MFHSSTYISILLLLLSLFSAEEIWGQQKDSDQTEAPGIYWVAVGQNLAGESAEYRLFNRSSKCDDCSELIVLPFSFSFYGEQYEQVYLNANGNISFGQALSEYTPSDFCLEGPKMIAPFYADVDIHQCGSIQYHVDEHSLIITWTEVCHYIARDEPTGLTNTFQLILTDGFYTHIHDIALPQRASVLFNYQDMQWTAGHSSGGQEGLGGQPATVGVNQGDGQICFAYGSFDHEGTDLPQSEQTGGVSHLDYRYIAWNGKEGLLASLSQAEPNQVEPEKATLRFAVKAYPNPSVDHLSLEIKLTEAGEVFVQLTDMSGRRVYGKKRLVPSREMSMEIPTESLSNGLYYLSVHYSDQVWQTQIAKV
ncbi:MAG: nidogen-like domain-containing protein [Bacteroidia bacterium]